MPLACARCWRPLPWEQGLCTGCLGQHWQDLARWEGYPGPLVGHCGQYWPIVSVPMAVPCCGWVLGVSNARTFEETDSPRLDRAGCTPGRGVKRVPRDRRGGVG
jgi:hypothetical protein